MPINKTKLFRAVLNMNPQLITAYKLPFMDPIEQVMNDVLKTVTLPVYSVFSPLVLPFALNLDDMVRVREYDMLTNMNNTQVTIAREYFNDALPEEGPYDYAQSMEHRYWSNKDKIHMQGYDRNANTYFLPDEILRYNLIDISSVIHDRARTSDTDVAYTWYRGSMLELIPAVVDTIAYTQMIGSMGVHQRFQFLPPNKIYLRGYFDNIIIKGRFEHQNLETMTMSEYHQILKLFNLDFQVFSYNALLPYNGNVGGAYGPIQINLDSMANAAEKREEYIKQLDDQLASSNSDWVDYL